MFDEATVHVLGGGIGGTVGAVLTCPLEVVKVRLQSSKGAALSTSSVPVITTKYKHFSSVRRIFCRLYGESSPCACKLSNCEIPFYPSTSEFVHTDAKPIAPISNTPGRVGSPKLNVGFRRSVILRTLTDICQQEGVSALFKGLLPTLIGVLPSRGVYFCAYHKGQVFFEEHFQSGSSGIYLCAAGFGSIAASSLTNPIWFIKTRLQLDSRPGHSRITVSRIIRNTWSREGIRGFYRGMSASYFGSLETALNFMIYENFKSRLLWWDRQRKQAALNFNTIPSTALINNSGDNVKTSDFKGSKGGSKLTESKDMVLCMVASACSKIIAITALYPHEVARTRLREENGRYRGFFRTLRMVVQEEGVGGLYRGMATHYIRQVPNSCIMIGTYEFVVFMLQSWDLMRKPH